MNWERCAACGSDHVTVDVREEREVAAAENLMVSVARNNTYGGARRSVMPAVTLRVELIWLRCLGCRNRWRG